VFSREEDQKAKKHMKKCSPTHAIKEMQIKTRLTFHVTKDVGKKEPSCIAVGNVS
jgi:hypothetical protein